MRLVTVAKTTEVRSDRSVCTNVRDFGARGDGVSDDSGAFQRAVDAATPGCTVLVPRGTYFLAAGKLINIGKSLTLFLDAGAQIWMDVNSRFVLSGTGSDITIAGTGAESVIRDIFSGVGHTTIIATSGSINSFTLRNLFLRARSTGSAWFTIVSCSATSAGVYNIARAGDLRLSVGGEGSTVVCKNIDARWLDIDCATFILEDSSPPLVLVSRVSDYGRVSNCTLSQSLQLATLFASGVVDILNTKIIAPSGYEPVFVANTMSRLRISGCILETSGQDKALVQMNSNVGEVIFEGSVGRNTAAAQPPTVPAFRRDGLEANVKVSNSTITQYTQLTAGKPLADTYQLDLAVDKVISRGADLAAADVALSAEWGTGPSLVVSGRDLRGSVTVTAGTTPAANPTITITFKRQFSSAPFAIVKRGNSTSPFTEPVWTTSTTQLVITFPATPVAGTAYRFDWVVIG